MRTTLRNAAFLVSVALALFATPVLQGDEVADRILKGMNKERAGEVRQLIAKELKPGSSAKAIVAFFERHRIEHSWDRLSRRHQAIIRDVAHSPDVHQAVVIYVYVDDKGQFVRAEVFDSFTEA